MNNKRPQVSIHVKRKAGRNDSMFYYDKHIATVKHGLKTIIVESCGEMEASLVIDGKQYYGKELSAQLTKRQIKDRQLNKIGSNDLISMNNWFRIFSDNDPVDTEEEIVHTYDDAIRMAKIKAKQ